MKSLSKQSKKRRQPLWAGPSGEGPNGGVTQGLIGKWLSCKERFRLLAVEGLKARERFSHRLHYGQMWHVCEEALAGPKPIQWELDLLSYRDQLFRVYPTDKVEVEKWYNVCLRQFPLYVQYWSKHPDVTSRTPLLSEVAFDVPYTLPSGRTVRLRGKWDSVDLVDGQVWLQENKTKGDIDEVRLKAQLASGFSLQVMLYLTALEIRRKMWQGSGYPEKTYGEMAVYPIAGVRYNVIRRPLSGGKGTIVQGKGTDGSKCPKCDAAGRVVLKGDTESSVCPKCNGRCRLGGKPPETDAAYYDRLAQYIKDEPEYFFMRWNVGITTGDIARFRKECLDPILDAMSNWYDHVTSSRKPFDCTAALNDYNLHWRTPYGIWNPLEDGGSSEYDAHLADGMEVGLERVSVMFPEL